MQKVLIVCRSFTILLLISFQHVSIAYGESGCEQANWGLPLEGKPTVNSPFNSTSHYGTDYKAADGDNVLAVADGVILKNGFNLKKLNRPDPRSALMIKGWGRYVVLKHNDGSTTLYAHLIEDSTAHLKEGDPVTKGTIIGKADSTGGVTGPHLHLEYTSDGMWWRKSSRKDPHPCILGCKPEDILTITGSDTPVDGDCYTASGGTEPYTWTITKGSIDTNGCVTVAGQCGTATITVTDANGCSGTKEVNLSAENCSSLTIVNENGAPATDTILRGGSKDYKITGDCCAGVVWSVSGEGLGGSTITQDGVLTAGAEACGSLLVTATCASCGTSATQYVRVTDAGGWANASIIYECSQSCYWITGVSEDIYIGNKRYYNDFGVLQFCEDISCACTAQAEVSNAPFDGYEYHCYWLYECCRLIRTTMYTWICP